TNIGELKYGIDINQYIISPGAFSTRTSASSDFVRKSQNESALEIAPHIEISSKITNNLSYIGGVRWVNYISYGQREFFKYRDNIFETDYR
ncbi:MAG TPA: hypothetical protein PKD85_22915, partial [Saprospiraceae bacterium]|nr:hypothetical protein [Saprospiraceae bacterium]